LPRRNNALLRVVGRAGLTVLGWRVEGNFPDLAKFIVIVAPHSSNWDFVVALAIDLATDLEAVWFGKHTIFRGPFGTVLRTLGGIPVRRDESHNVVDQLVAEFQRRERMVLALAPEGTRRRVVEWRTGFWYIARGAQVPIVPGGLDYARRRAVIGEPFWPTGRIDEDLHTLQEFYRPFVPKRTRRP
jgi:1-acyl-sn-glycerol-3-phosphate acyltransferase